MRTSYKGKFKIDKHEFLMALHFCFAYPELKREYNAMIGLSHNGQSEGGSGGIGDPTAKQAIRLSKISNRIDLIERTARNVCCNDPGLYPYLLRGVTEEGMSFDKLIAHGMPCGRKMYHVYRRKFYYFLVQSLN